MENWNQFGIHPSLLKIIKEKLQYRSPTNIQQEVLRYININDDLLIASKTGSGKTLCYLLPVLNRLMNKIDQDPEFYLKKKIEALVILPARELAIQVFKEFNKFLGKNNDQKYSKLEACLLVGGVSK